MADNYGIIKRLFDNVLQEQVRQYKLNHAAIRTGIQNMKEVYKPNPTSLKSEFLDVANYNDPAHRVAYLHKYAPLHTALVSDMLSRAMQQVKFILQETLSDTGRLEICSLGGGPGSDALGVISILSAEFGYFQLSATIIDYMSDWRYTFAAIIRELHCGDYGFISDFIQPQYFSWNYIGHNLLGKMTNDVNKAIQNAKLITMVKFVSAAACKDTAEMVKKIFRSLKPGALVLFIDNDAGGFYRLAKQGATESSLITVFGPLIHEHYENKTFDVRKFGYIPCLETKITVHMWMKPNYNRSNLNKSANFLGNTSNVQIRNVNNTFNQYNISNTNIYVTETNCLNFPYNIQHQTYLPNFRQYDVEDQSSHIPIQRQPQASMLPSSSSITNTSQNKTFQIARQQNHKKQSTFTAIQKQPQGDLLSNRSPMPDNSNFFHEVSQMKNNRNARPQNYEYQSSHLPTQRDSHPHATHNNPSNNTSNYREESEVDCCNCCVIS